MVLNGARRIADTLIAKLVVLVLCTAQLVSAGCSAEPLSQSVGYLAFGFSSGAACVPEDLVTSFAAAKGFDAHSAGALMQNGRREVKISLRRESALAATAMSNLLLPRSEGRWFPYLVRVDFYASPRPSASEVEIARERLETFKEWMTTHNPQCWQVIESSG